MGRPYSRETIGILVKSSGNFFEKKKKTFSPPGHE